MAIVLYQYFMEIKANVTPGTVGTYGLRNLLRMLNFEQEKPSLLMLLGSFIWITLAISACLYALISGYQFSTQSRKNPSDYRNQSFVFASIIFITTTLVNTNYCYRLIWCVIAISLMREKFSENSLFYVTLLLYVCFSGAITSAFYLQRNLSSLLISAILLGSLLRLIKENLYALRESSRCL